MYLYWYIFVFGVLILLYMLRFVQFVHVSHVLGNTLYTRTICLSRTIATPTQLYSFIAWWYKVTGNRQWHIHTHRHHLIILLFETINTSRLNSDQLNSARLFVGLLPTFFSSVVAVTVMLDPLNYFANFSFCLTLKLCYTLYVQLSLCSRDLFGMLILF